MLEPRYLTARDLVAIKKASGFDMNKLFMETARAFAKNPDAAELGFEVPLELIVAINDQVRGEEGKDESFADSMKFAVGCFMLTFSGTDEKKSQSIGNG